MKIAVIGGGIAGLSAAYYLKRLHDVTLFEKSDRLGGNAFSHETSEGVNIDIAAAVFGHAGYPHFHALLDELGVETSPVSCYMSFHNKKSGHGLYITPNLKGSYAQRFDILKPSNMKSLVGLYMGLRAARKKLKTGEWHNMTLDECLARLPQIDEQARLIFLCILCLISSMAADEVLATPAEFFLEKIDVHDDLLTPRAVYAICCMKQGTRAYTEALAAHIGSKNIVYNSKIKKVLRQNGKVTLEMSNGRNRLFDKVVFACPSDVALKLLDKPTAKEKKLLGVWRYKEGRLVVHRDHSAFPARNLIQGYTFIYDYMKGKLNTSVNGALWYLPYVPDNCDYIASQHPNYPIRKDLIEADVKLRTPIFDFDSFASIKDMPSLNGTKNCYYCGSNFGFGLHEDAVRSAADIAEELGVEVRRRPRFKLFNGVAKALVDKLAG